MGASEEEMTALLRQRGFLPTASIRTQLLELENLEGVLKKWVSTRDFLPLIFSIQCWKFGINVTA